MEMFRPKVHLSIEIWPGDVRHAVTSLDISIIRDTFEKLDFPSPTARVRAAELLCTDAVRRQRVMLDRRHIACKLTNVLVEMILDAMGAGDTEMGYPKPKGGDASGP